MRGKWLAVGVLLLLFLFLVNACAKPAPSPTPSPTPPKVITLKLSSYLPETGTESQMGKWWGSELEKRSNGRVKVEYYFAQALVKTMDTLPAVSKGIADVQFVANGYFPTQLPLTGGLDLIYQTESNWVLSKCFNEMAETYPPFQKMLKDNNIKNMSCWAASEVVMVSPKPIRTVKDLKGLRIRAMGLMNKVMEMLGATPVAMPLPEVYEALQRGVIDAVTGIPYHLVVSFKLNEVAKYVVDPGMGCYATGGYYMNLDTWNSLPDDIKAIIDQINEEFPDVAAELSNELLQKTTETLLAAGNEVYCLPPKEIERWKAKLVPRIYEDWIKEMGAKGLPGRETLEKYHELIRKYAPMDKYKSPYPCS